MLIKLKNGCRNKENFALVVFLFRLSVEDKNKNYDKKDLLIKGNEIDLGRAIKNLTSNCFKVKTSMDKLGIVELKVKDRH